MEALSILNNFLYGPLARKFVLILSWNLPYNLHSPAMTLPSGITHRKKKNHISFLCLKIAITSLFKVKHPHLSESLNKVPQSFTILVHSFFFFILVHSLYCSTCCRWLSVTHLFKTICHHFFYIFPGSRRCSIKHFDQFTIFLYISTDQQNCYTLVNTLYSPQLK